MRVLQRYLAVALLLSVVGAVWLTLRSVPLPDVARVDRTIKETEPRQEETDRRPFTTTIKGYTYTLTPRAAYAISGLVVSQHRGDALLNLYHQEDPGNIRDVCLVWGDDVTNGSYRKVAFWSGEFTCSYRWSGVLTPAFNPAEVSNNHLIPASEAIARPDPKRYGQWRVRDTLRHGPVRGGDGPSPAGGRGRSLWYTSLALLVALGVVWFVRRPLAE